jgi:hypothetical protein
VAAGAIRAEAVLVNVPVTRITVRLCIGENETLVAGNAGNRCVLAFELERRLRVVVECHLARVDLPRRGHVARRAVYLHLLSVRGLCHRARRCHKKCGYDE